LKISTFTANHVGISQGGSHAFAKKILLRAIVFAEFAFGYFFDLRTQRAIRTDGILTQFAHSPENIHRKIIPAIFT
jgi:hypothetical protein